MLSRFTRLPLRRCFHSQANPPRYSRYARTVLGASAATLTYLSWRLLSDPIALDSQTTTPPLQKPTVTSKPLSKATVASSPSGSTPETSISNLDPPSKLPTPSQPLTQDDERDHHPGSKQDGTSVEQQSEEEDGSSQGPSGGAFNPETGEINWDCPCLGGMAHGPCGSEFREAFSCFVFSEQEPKGIDCVEKFKAMQDCFRQHPEVYSDEIMDDNEEETAATSPSEPAPVSAKTDENNSSTEHSSIPRDTPAPPTVPS